MRNVCIYLKHLWCSFSNKSSLLYGTLPSNKIEHGKPFYVFVYFSHHFIGFISGSWAKNIVNIILDFLFLLFSCFSFHFILYIVKTTTSTVVGKRRRWKLFLSFSMSRFLTFYIYTFVDNIAIRKFRTIYRHKHKKLF